MSGLAGRADMFGGAGGGGGGFKKKPHPSALIESIAKNACESADFGSSSIFAIKPLEWTEKLCEAMAGNTALVSLDLSDCALDDKCCDLLGAVLEADQKLEKLILNKNAIRDGGCAKLATSLARNITLREIELFGQTGGRKWGEGCLVTWLEMYKTNFSIIRVNWSTNSKNTVTLTKMLARNMDINNKVKNGDTR